MRYRPEVDGLRALAVVPVILHHAGFKFISGGFVGVDIFFVISGYLITTIIVEELERGDFSIRRFYERRARRILPSLLFVMACTIPFAWMWMLPNELRTFSNTLVSVLFFASNMRLWFQSGYFDSTSDTNPLLHTWSLAVEEQYYMIFPLALLLGWQFGRNRIILAIIVISLCSLALSEWGSRHWPSANFYLVPTRIWEILAGSLCAFVLRGGPPLNVQLSGSAASLGLVLVCLAIFAFDHHTPTPSTFTLIPVLGTCLILIFAGQGTLTTHILSSRPAVGIGLISYSAYLWHQPIFAFARIRLVTPPTLGSMLALSVCVLAFAYISWRFIETPWRRQRFSTSRVSQTKAGVVIAFAAGLMAFGFIGHFKHGWPHRVSPAVFTAANGEFDTGAYHGSCLLKAIESIRAPNEKCRLGTKSERIDFILMGDSFAVSLAEGLNQVALRAGKSGLIIATNSCLPIRGIGGIYAATSAVCDALQRQMGSIVKESGAKVVILHGAWHELDDKYLPQWRRSNSQSNFEAFSTPFFQTLEMLKSADVKVYIVCCTPNFPLHVPKALAKLKMYSDTTDIRLPAEQVVFANRTALSLFHSEAASHLANLVDVMGYFCDSEYCKLDEGGKPLMFDKGHLSRFGSLQLASRLEAIFE